MDLKAQFPGPYHESDGSRLSTHLHQDLPSGIFHLGSLTKMLQVFIIIPLHAACPIHHILTDLITTIIFSNECVNYEPSHYVTFFSLLLHPLS